MGVDTVRVMGGGVPVLGEGSLDDLLDAREARGEVLVGLAGRIRLAEFRDFAGDALVAKWRSVPARHESSSG